MTQDSLSPYGRHLDPQGGDGEGRQRRRRKVAEAIRTMDTTEVRRGSFRAAISSSTRRAGAVGAPLVIVQWQNGEPVAVFPKEVAAMEPMWTKQ